MPEDGTHLICKKHESEKHYSLKLKEWCCVECDVE